MSGWYLDGKEQLLARTIPQTAGVYAVGVNEDYSYDESHSDPAIFAPYILLPEVLLAGVTFTDGILRAENPKWLAAGAGVTDRSLVLTGIVVYFQEGDSGALLAFIDSVSVGLPATLTGVNVTAEWDSQGILKL